MNTRDTGLFSLVGLASSKGYSAVFRRPYDFVARQLRKKRARRYIQNCLEHSDVIKLEIGAGEKKGKNGWLTIDLTWKCDIFWDLREGIPFPDASVSNIYSSHLFEHLTYPEGQLLLDECMRVLKPGGQFSICVPNARLYIDAYVNSQVLDEKKYFPVPRSYNHTTKIDYVNYIAYMRGLHKYMFDQENLLHILNSKGFRNVRNRSFDPELDLISRDYESIYAVAER
jgi:predicted SAM-dependent methyltransferase